ncbi:hypothetical protein MMN56_06705, partial [Escherichia coli]|nr:hypothetical protein [Escherichia coli]
SAEFTIGEGELMAHDVPLGCAPDEYDDLISGTCSHLPYFLLCYVPCLIYYFFYCRFLWHNDFMMACDMYFRWGHFNK